ncbi:MAG: hypothetical protein MZU97_19090 [Bacillus subtilis]|nr:hypothetical protein [Bacillus subtilis]
MACDQRVHGLTVLSGYYNIETAKQKPRRAPKLRCLMVRGSACRSRRRARPRVRRTGRRSSGILRILTLEASIVRDETVSRVRVRLW